MRADVRDAQRLRAVDEDAEDAASARQVADRAVRLVVDAARDEALELAAVAIEDPERGVARARDLAGGFEHLVEHGLRVELRQQTPADVDEATEPCFVEMIVHVGKSPGGRDSPSRRPRSPREVCGTADRRGDLAG